MSWMHITRLWKRSIVFSPSEMLCLLNRKKERKKTYEERHSRFDSLDQRFYHYHHWQCDFHAGQFHVWFCHEPDGVGYLTIHISICALHRVLYGAAVVGTNLFGRGVRPLFPEEDDLHPGFHIGRVICSSGDCTGNGIFLLPIVHCVFFGYWIHSEHLYGGLR